MTDDSLLSQLAEEFTRMVRDGSPPNIEEYANRYPELAGRIRELFPTLVLLEGAAADKRNDSSEQTASKAPQAESPQAGTLPQRQRFVAGDVLAGRYRIISLLGKGGMGEVYRAEDLKLSQSIALKFLPEKLADDGAALARLYREVSIARQVSHPNVCRVYDIGEVGAEHFLSMEYIDGEDLASLLRRIGRLPADKAIDIGCQLCAGLASIHGTGVLHRDIKPANVIIDGRGRARITDFGLASVADQLRELSCAGTPAYMAPEQLQGGKLSQKVDIYALGHVLYEMFTGRRVYGAENGENIGSTQERREPTPPSAIVKDMDPRIERVILRCLEKNPQNRPSAKEIATALAGKDLIGEALAAGEIPSPEMLAAAGHKDGWKPWLAWACLAFVVLGIGAVVALSRQYYLIQRMPLEKPPEVLLERAREILRKVGYPETPIDNAFGFAQDDDYFQYVRDHDRSSSRWDWLPDSALQFWYRQSPSFLARKEMIQDIIFPIVGVTYYDPQPIISGEACVWLDGRGRLIELEVLPPEMDKSAGIPQTPDWSTLFREAGLDPAKWVAAEPTWTPTGYADTRAAWQGTLPERPEIAMRVEAAAYRGKPVFWRLIGPWAKPSRTASEPSSIGAKISDIVTVSIVAVIIVGALIARRNLRRGRGDRRGAGRMAFFVFALMAVAWVFSEHHVPPAQGEIFLIFMFAGSALLTSGIIWLLYIALEPLVRRRWPVSLISWSRLLSGRFRDSLVGRDLLVGCVFGVILILLDHLERQIPVWVGSPNPAPEGDLMQYIAGARAIIPATCSALIMCIERSFWWLFIIFLLRVLLRRQWAAAMAFIIILAGLGAMGNESPLLGCIFGALGWGTCLLLVLLRFGFVAAAAGMFVKWMLGGFPLTMQLSAWYSGIGFTGVALVLILAIYAFHTSLAGQPLFGRASLED